MNIIFDNAAAAWLGALILAPPLIHLFAKALPPRYRFSSTALLMRVVRNTMRLRRPKDWLLLVLRTLLVAALVALFLRPVLFLGRRASGVDNGRSMVLVVDRTASMSWTKGGQTRFASVCAEAAEMLNGFTARDQANIVWLDAEPDSVFPEMGSNIPFLQQRLAEARVSFESGDPAAAIELALSLLESGSGTLELCIVSDYQAVQWADVRAAIPDGVNVYTLASSADDAGNGAILSLQADPPRPLAGELVRIVCEVGNFSAEPRSRSVTFGIGERRVNRDVMLPAWGRGSVAVEHVFRETGRTVLNARLDEDGFSADDWRGAAVSVRSALRVGMLGVDPRFSPIWMRALRALPWIDVIPLDETNLEGSADGLDLLMLAGWRGEAVDTLSLCRTNGLAMICAPAEGVRAADLIRLAGPDAFGAPQGVTTAEHLSEAVSLRIAKADSAALRLFRDGDYGDPANASCRERLLFPFGPGGSVLMEYDDGVPALVVCETSPTLLLWGVPLNPEASDWAARLPFLPFFGELVASVRTRRAGALPDDASTGEPVSWLAGLQYEEVRLTNERGADVPFVVASTDIEGRRLVSDPIRQPGVYHWLADGRPHSAKVVNFPVGESDLRTMAPPAFGDDRRMLRTGEDLITASRGNPLWPTCLWAAFAFLLGELAVVLWCDQETRRLSEEAQP